MWLVDAVRGKPYCAYRKRNRPSKFTACVQHTVPPLEKMLKSDVAVLSLCRSGSVCFCMVCGVQTSSQQINNKPRRKDLIRSS